MSSSDGVVDIAEQEKNGLREVLSGVPKGSNTVGNVGKELSMTLQPNDPSHQYALLIGVDCYLERVA